MPAEIVNLNALRCAIADVERSRAQCKQIGQYIGIQTALHEYPPTIRGAVARHYTRTGWVATFVGVVLRLEWKPIPRSDGRPWA